MSTRPDQAGEPRCWDEQQALQMADSDAQLLQELLQIWNVQAPDFIASVRAAAMSSEQVVVGSLLHRLKGSLQLIAAMPALTLIASIEQRYRESPLMNRCDLMMELAESLAQLDQEIADWLATPTANYGYEGLRKKKITETGNPVQPQRSPIGH